jgi:type VI secretion system protein ImpA
MTVEFIAHQDWSDWLNEIPGNQRCGPDLEFDPQFREVEEAASGRPEAEYGATLVAAVLPDWKLTDALCVELLSRSRDLRIVAQLSRARLAIDGVTGLADGLALARWLIEDQWEHVHPQPDADDNNDPTARINALAAFVDSTGLLADLYDTPLLDHSRSVTLREWSYASGEVIAPEHRTVLSIAEIEAAIASSIDAAARTETALNAAVVHVTRIEAVLTERVGAAQALDLGALKMLLQRAGALIGDCLAKLGVNTSERAQGDISMRSAETTTETEALTEPAGHLNSRSDVIAMLDWLCAYYARHEPSSPVPLLLGRARGLVDKSFIDLVMDLAPEGLAQLNNVIGKSSAA